MKNIYTVYLNNSSEKNKNDDSEANDQSSTNQFTNMFVYYDNEISRNISKCIIHITRSMQLEYNGYSRFNSRYKNYYFSTLDNIHILLRLTLPVTTLSVFTIRPDGFTSIILPLNFIPILVLIYCAWNI